MPDTVRPVGQRYTHVYLERPSKLTDSGRLRNRVAEWFYANLSDLGGSIRADLRTELGANVPGGYDSLAVRDFLKSAEVHEFLDALTIISIVLSDYNKRFGGDVFRRWHAFVNRALSETGVAFELDDRGGVHPRVDAVFLANRQSTLSGLGHPKHAEALGHFDQAYGALDGASPQTGRAIREMHLAIEAVFKQAYPQASKIDVGEINTHLKKAAVSRLSGAELETTKLMLTSAGNLISAGHQYRHAAGEPEPAPPSMDTAVWMLSQGTSFLRWLIAFVENEPQG